MEKEFIEIPFEVKDVDEKGVFKGFASTFGGAPDSHGDIIALGAFNKTLAKGGRNKSGIPILWHHDSSNPIGKFITLTENVKGLAVEGKLTKGVKQADDALLLMQDKVIKFMSIGFTIPKNGAEFDNEKYIRTIKEIDLWEISLVTFPANTRAKVTSVKMFEDAKTERDIEAALRESGLSKKRAQIVIAKTREIVEAKYNTSLRDSKIATEEAGLDSVLSELHQARIGFGIARELH